MINAVSRRHWLGFAPLGLPGMPLSLAAQQPDPGAPENFPSQPVAMVREMVTVAHGNVKRVRELLESRPTLANASWDWGFGDWETALGAASHVGNREIAELLLTNGAGPTLFSATMLGQLEAVKAMVEARPGVQRTLGPHSISLLSHARAGGPLALPVFRFLESLGDAAGTSPTEISEEELARFKGNYLFGSSPNDSIEITLKGKQLTFTRKGATGRPIHYVGDQAFRPAGASAVRIRFRAAGPDLVLTVHDPDIVLTARRVSSD
jgi:hypothetical protein